MVVAATDIFSIPRSILIWVRGLVQIIRVNVQGWIEEPLPYLSPSNPTPPKEVFQQTSQTYYKAETECKKDGKEFVTIDSNVLFSD